MNLSDYLKGISNHMLLTKEEEQKLFNRTKRGDEKARRKIIVSNLRLVVNIAKRYLNAKVSLQDLIQEGNMGLIRSVDKFKPELDRRFSTYATFWIKQSILKFLNETRNVVRYPSYINDNLSKINKFINGYREMYGKNPTQQAIAKNLELDLVEVNKYINLISVAYISLEEQFENDTKVKYISSSETTIEDTMIESYENSEIVKMIEKLKEKEREILIHRYGLFGKKKLTLEKLGEKLNLTRERVRQIQNTIIEKLREKVKLLS